MLGYCFYCTNCETFKPVRVSQLGCDDVTGKFTNGADILCEVCALVIATIAEPKQPSSGSGDK